MRNYFQRKIPPSRNDQPFRRKASKWFVGAAAVIILGMLPVTTGYLSRNVSPNIYEPTKPYDVMLVDTSYFEASPLEKYLESYDTTRQ